ncbi:hypothetical protein KCU85_g233, partial [Aureobasidium melanogenum]
MSDYTRSLPLSIGTFVAFLDFHFLDELTYCITRCFCIHKAAKSPRTVSKLNCSHAECPGQGPPDFNHLNAYPHANQMTTLTAGFDENNISTAPVAVSH